MNSELRLREPSGGLPVPRLPLTKSRSLYKYFSERRWAEAFLNGELLFRSLAYFRDHEDKGIRGDQDEGVSTFRPEGGLAVNNLTQGKTFTLPGYALESTTKQEEIFVYCLSRSFADELRERFGAAACVEILDIPKFCGRIESSLPPEATFPGRPGRTRVGVRVEYYRESDDCNPRWALPDVIATSKSELYAWQDEFRLVFSLTNALGFEKVNMRVTRGRTFKEPASAEHRPCLVKVSGGLGDICRLHGF